MDTKLIENIGNLPVELRSKIFSFGAVQHPLANMFNKHVKFLKWHTLELDIFKDEIRVII